MRFPSVAGSAGLPRQMRCPPRSRGRAAISCRASTPYAYGNQNDEEKYTGLNFDLVTGDELSFDDIFVKGANVEGLVYKRFYSQLSSDYAFDLLDVERGIEGKEAGNCTMYCDPSVSLEEYRARKSEIEMKIANIEEIAMVETKQYLAGERKFYLESAGPVFIFDDGRRETRRYFTSATITG